MMVRSKSEIWDHFVIEGKKSICKFCNKEAFKNPSRMPVHLLKCDKCPTSIKARLSSTISKSCLQLCKKVPGMEDRISQSYISDNQDYDRIADIEIVNEEVVDACNEVYLPLDGKMKMYSAGLNESSWGERIKQDNSFIRKIEEEKVLDEFSVFGDCVANKLRNIDNPQARSIAQYYINTILFRAEMTNFKDDVVVPSPQEFGMFDSLRKDSSIKVTSVETDLMREDGDEST